MSQAENDKAVLVPKLPLGNPEGEAPASQDGKQELPAPNSQAGAWELADFDSLPQGWAIAKTSVAIGANGIIADGDWIESKDQDPNGDVRLIQLADIGDGDFRNKSERFMTSKNAVRMNCTFLETGDLLIARMPDPLGRACLFPGVGQKAVTVVDICLIRPNTGSALQNKLLMHWINTPQIRNFIAMQATGTTRKRITRKKLEALELPIPPLAEQQQIAAKLDELLAQVDTLKTRLETLPKILKRFRLSILSAAVSGRLTEDWREKFDFEVAVGLYDEKIKEEKFKVKINNLNLPSPLFERPSWLALQFGHIFNVKSGAGLTAKDMATNGTIPVYGGNGITGHHDQSNISEATIVIGRVGFYCGSVHLTENIAWVTDNALIVSFPRSLVTRDFAYFLLKATNLRIDSASTAQPVISGTKIYPIEISLPSIEEQTEIVRRVKQLFTYADKIEQRVKDAQARVNHLTQAILTKAFRGELTADWREQNPDLISGENSAAALLAKIKAEREKIKNKKL